MVCPRWCWSGCCCCWRRMKGGAAERTRRPNNFETCVCWECPVVVLNSWQCCARKQESPCNVVMLSLCVTLRVTLTQLNAATASATAPQCSQPQAPSVPQPLYNDKPQAPTPVITIAATTQPPAHQPTLWARRWAGLRNEEAQRHRLPQATDHHAADQPAAAL